MPAADRGREDVEPDMNQSNSAITARRKTRLVVRRGRIGVEVPGAGGAGSGGSDVLLLAVG